MRPTSPDRAIARLAARQHGVVARRQLRDLGLGLSAIDHRVSSGRLHVLYRGVYAVGHPRLPPRARWMAAVLAGGPGTVLSHGSAAALWGFRPTASARVDVTVPSRAGRGRTGIALHRVHDLRDEDRALCQGIPVTAVSRTLLDLAEVVSARQLERALEEAERLRLLDYGAIQDICGGRPGRHGLAPLRTVLAGMREPLPVRSELERRFAELCEDANLPPPALNVAVAGCEVDAHWPHRRLIVELDGFAHHRSRTAFEEDRVRDVELQLAGYRVLRITARRLEREPAAIVAAIRALLLARPG